MTIQGIKQFTFNDALKFSRHRKAFFTCKAGEDKKTWIAALRGSLSFPHIRCHANNIQLGCYLMQKLESTLRENQLPHKRAVECIGLQSIAETPKTWVLNSQVHVDERGNTIDPDCSPYVWLGQFIEDDLASSAKLRKKRRQPLQKLLESLKPCYQANSPAVLLTFGAQVLCLHYEGIHKDAKACVPAAVVFGDVSTGKSKATRASLALLGMEDANLLHSVSDTKAMKVTAKSTTGIVIDDPSDHSQIAEKILHQFEHGKSTTCSATYTPRCTFITSVNKECLERLASLPPRQVMLLLT